MGDKESGDTTTANVEVLLETILENSQTSEYFPQLPKYQHWD